MRDRDGLPWRPGQRASAEKMHVEVRDGLAPIGAVVDDKPEPRIRDAFGFGDLPSGDEQVAEELRICGKRFPHARDRPLRDNEDMDRRLGGNIAEREAKVVLEDDARRNFPGDDFFEEGHESCRWSSCALRLMPSSPRTKDTISPRSPEQSRRQFFAERSSFTHR